MSRIGIRRHVSVIHHYTGDERTIAGGFVRLPRDYGMTLRDAILFARSQGMIYHAKYPSFDETPMIRDIYGRMKFAPWTVFCIRRASSVKFDSWKSYFCFSREEDRALYMMARA